MFEREAETMPRAPLAALQLERLRGVVGRVMEKVAFYRDHLGAAGITVESLWSLDDLARLPFTHKGDLRDNYPFGLFAVPRPQVVRLHASSGTKGKPTVVGYTAADIDLWARCCARCLVCAGARPGDIVHNAYGYGLFTGGLGLHYRAERLGGTVVPASGGNTPRQVLLLQDFTARDIYGLSEVLGPGVAMECAEGRDGLHIWEDHFLPEIVDPESGEQLPDGRFGELVITTLSKEAMPVIRYRTGDITAVFAEPCPCGRTHRRMARVAGRTDDMLIVRGVNVFPSEIERVLMEMPDLAPHYQIVVDRQGALDTLEVHAEVTPEFRAAALQDVGLLAALRERVNGALDAALGVSTDVVLHPPGSLPRSEGKAVRVHDRRLL